MRQCGRGIKSKGGGGEMELRWRRVGGGIEVMWKRKKA